MEASLLDGELLIFVKRIFHGIIRLAGALPPRLVSALKVSMYKLHKGEREGDGFF